MRHLIMIVLLSAAKFSPVPAAGADKPLAAGTPLADLADLADGDAFTVPDDGRTKSVTLDVTVRLADGVAPETVTASLASLSFANLRIAELNNAFAVQPKLQVVSKTVSQVRVAVEVSKIPEQGIYNLGLRLEMPGREATLPIHITRLPAELAAQPLFLEHRSLWPWGDATPETLTVDLDELSQKSRITSLKVTSQRDSGGKNQPNLSIPSVEAPPLVPGGHQSLSLPLQGHAEPGTAKGSLTFRAPQLKAPVTVPYEVQWRASDWLLMIGIVVGLLIGMYFRRVLTERLALESVRTEVRELRRKIAQQIAAVADRGFRAEAQACFLDLKSKEQTAKQEDLTKLIADTKTAVEKAVEKVADAVKRQSPRYDGLAVLASSGWFLPANVSAIVARALGNLSRAQTAIEKSDPSTAKEILDAAENILREKLQPAVTEWKRTMNTKVANLATSATALPASLVAEFEAARGRVKTGIDSIVPAPASVPLALLQQVHAARTQLDSFLDLAVENLRSEAGWVRERLAAKGKVDEKVLTALDKQLFALFEQAAAGSIEDRLGQLSAIVEGVAQVLGDTLRGLVPPGSDPEAIRELVEAHKLREATQEVVELRRGEIPLGRAPTATVAGEKWALVEAGSPPTAGGAPLNLPDALHEIDFETQRSQSIVRRATQAQFIIVALATTAVGYYLFEPSFIGTCRDIMAVMFWGFSTDVSANTLIGILPKRS